MTKYVAHFEDGFHNYNIFETDTTDKKEIVDLAWQSAYEVANSDIKYVEWYELEGFDDGIEPMIVIGKEEYDNLKINSAKYQSLESEGVDNWSGYHYAVKNYKEKTGEDWW